MTKFLLDVLSAIFIVGAVAFAISIAMPREQWQHHEVRR